jgi:hypothetical protein
MDKYCVTAANHNNANDERASEFDVWKWTQTEATKWMWIRQGKKSLSYVAGLLAKGDEVVSAEAEKTGANSYIITPGYPIELELRIAKNDKKFKITDLPTF